MMSEKDPITFRLLDTSFDSVSSREEERYEAPSHSEYRWKRNDQRRLLWSSRKPRHRQARLIVPSVGALLFLFWLYTSDRRTEQLSALTAARSKISEMKEVAHRYHKNVFSPSRKAHNSFMPLGTHDTFRHSTAHDAILSTGDVADTIGSLVDAQEQSLLDLDRVHIPSKGKHLHAVHHPKPKPKDMEEVKEIIELVKQENPPMTISSSKVVDPIATPSSAQTSVASNTMPSTPPRPSVRDHLPSYEETLGETASVWTYQDDYIADHASCAAMRQKLQTKEGSSKEIKTPTHSKASIGHLDLFDSSTCSTYEDRFGPYTDQSLGLTYRKGKDVISSDWLLGPKKPKLMRNDQWTFYLQHRNRAMNSKVTREMKRDIPDWKALSNRCGLDSSIKVPLPKHRTIILHRFYEGFVLTEDKILDLRAMLTEMVINRPNDGWDIRILVELKETPGAFVSKALQRAVLESMMPFEFWGLVEFWSEDREKSIMPGLSGPLNYGFDISCLLPSQLYSFHHPQYDFIYNWEADLRFLGNYSTFFDAVEGYGRNESMNMGMQKYSRWLIPGSPASERHWNRFSHDRRGVGKEPDMITFNAVLDVEGSDWFHSSKHALEYGLHAPLRTSIVSLLRMSKHLLKAMTLATVEKEKAMQCEAWPSTAILHSQLPPSSDLTFDEELAAELRDVFPLKGVFVPHPVYIQDQTIDAEEIDYQINRRRYFRNEGFMAKSSFNWKSELSDKIYNRWRNHDGVDACRQPALMHPIKDVGYD